MVDIQTLQDDLNNAETITDMCVILLDHCFEDNELSEEQLALVFSLFGEADITSRALMFLYSNAESIDLYELSGLYQTIYNKFAENNEGLSIVEPAIKA